jgi:NAD(P)-dependent dehydrogenase (short-subunit alcohol dehydrogenase family)
MKNDNLFSGKVAWITGASSGIGESLVHEFVKKGATVIAS